MPIPGTTKSIRLVENIGAADVTLTRSELAEIDSAAEKLTASGARYPEQHQRLIDR